MSDSVRVLIHVCRQAGKTDAEILEFVQNLTGNSEDPNTAARASMLDSVRVLIDVCRQAGKTDKEILELAQNLTGRIGKPFQHL